MSITFSGGHEMERALKRISERAGANLEVGFFEGSTAGKDGKSAAEIAAYNEYGTETIPMRPFMLVTVRREQWRWGKLLGPALKNANFDGQQALEIIGQQIKGDIQETMREWDNPDNAPSTIKKKGFDDPLVDTGKLIDAVAFKTSKLGVIK